MLQTFFNIEILQAAWRIILAGLGNTLLLSIVVVPLGLFGGLILSLLAGVRNPWVRWPLMAWVDFFRAFPPLELETGERQSGEEEDEQHERRERAGEKQPGHQGASHPPGRPPRRQAHEQHTRRAQAAD